MNLRALFLLLLLSSLPAAAQVLYAVEPLEIRPAGEDYAPVLLNGDLVITSVRPRAQAIAYTASGSHLPLADLYQVPLREGRPGTPQLMEGSLCSRYNDGPAAFTAGGDTICFTRNIPSSKRSSDRLGLFFAVKQGREWSEAVPFSHNGTGHSSISPAFSLDGRSLYFASDRPGGSGGMDLYVSRKEAAGWSVPKNLGAAVNSAANEVFPSIGPHGALFFSSDREGGAGQLDLYTCASEFGTFSAPAALPAPLNSSGNDLGYAAQADGESGYFSSDRDGRDRIFRFTRSAQPFQHCVPQESNSYCFHFEDAGTSGTDTLPLRYAWDFGDGTSFQGLATDHCFAGPGTYTVKLNLMDTLSQSVYFNQVSYSLEVTDVEQAFITMPDSTGTGQPLTLDAEHSNLPGFTPLKTHWDLGDGTFAEGGRITHGFAQAGEYTVRLDLAGGPDGRGGYEQHCVFRNIRVIDGLEVQPLAASSSAASPAQSGFQYTTLPADAFGLTETIGTDVTYTVQLLASKERLGLNDARFLPLRRDYAILERFVPFRREYTYSIGSGTTPLSVYHTYARARQAGFGESVVKALDAERKLDLAQTESLPLKELDHGMLNFSSIRFRTGESRFDRDFEPTLDRILGLLVKHSEVDLVIAAHTDDVGDAQANLVLSQARAQAIMAYFTERGLDAERLLSMGHGEDRPIASNTTEAGRTLNRRVEFHLSVRDTNAPSVP